MNPQDWRTFIHSIEEGKPSEVLHVTEEIHPSHEIRIEESLAAFALLHHRAYGSVHGGSYSLA